MLCWRKVNWYNHSAKFLGNIYWSWTQATLGPSNSLPRYIPNRNAPICSPGDMHWMIIAALFTTVETWNLPKWPSTVERKFTQWSTYSSENERTTAKHEGTISDMMLKPDTQWMIPWTWSSKTGKTICGDGIWDSGYLVRGHQGPDGARGELLRCLECSALHSGAGFYSVCEECTDWIMICPFFLRYVKLFRRFFPHVSF